MAAQQSPPPLGANIRAARELLGMTQLDLAHRVGLKGANAGAYISRIEAGQQEPRLAILSKIAAALGSSVEKLMNGGRK